MEHFFPEEIDDVVKIPWSRTLLAHCADLLVVYLLERITPLRYATIFGTIYIGDAAAQDDAPASVHAEDLHFVLGEIDADHSNWCGGEPYHNCCTLSIELAQMWLLGHDGDRRGMHVNNA